MQPFRKTCFLFLEAGKAFKALSVQLLESAVEQAHNIFAELSIRRTLFL
jgi:hypothetical protein